MSSKDEIAETGNSQDPAGSAVVTSKKSALRKCSTKRPTATALAQMEDAALASLEEKVFRSSLDLVEGMHAWSDIDADATEPPQEWVDALGKKKAMKKFRIAKQSWLNSKDAPVVLRVLPPLAMAIMRARVGTQPMENQQRARAVEFPVADMAIYGEVIVKE